VATRHAPNHAHQHMPFSANPRARCTLATPLSTIAVRPLLNHCLVHRMVLAGFLPYSSHKSVFAMLPFPLIRLHKDYAAHITVHNVCDSRPQLAGFLATHIQRGMQPLPQYFPRLLSTVKMGYRLKKNQLTLFMFTVQALFCPRA
jgi:hypothetical protein